METETIVRHENNDSIEVNKNSKGFTFSVKLYGTFWKEGEVIRVINKINELVVILNEKYGRVE
jgi:hypothetical protein